MRVETDRFEYGREVLLDFSRDTLHVINSRLQHLNFTMTLPAQVTSHTHPIRRRNKCFAGTNSLKCSYKNHIMLEL